MSQRPPRSPEPAASVLLATYNRRRLLPAVLDPILADPGTGQVTVVVDGCEDGSLELLQQIAAEDPRLTPMFIPNRGAPRALLAGAQASTGEVLVILDDDEIVEPGSIAGHLRHHRGKSGLVVVGYVEVELPHRRKPGDFTPYKYARAYEEDCRAYERDPATILRNLWGGYISMRRADYLRVMSNVDEFVQGYHYDLDFGARCIEAGLRAEFDRSLRARHLYRRDRSAFLRDARSSGRNRILVHRAHPDVLEPIDATFMEVGLPSVARRVLELALRHRTIERLINGATTLAGHLRLWDVETRAARLMWAIEQKRGALEVIAEHERAASVTGASKR